MNWKFHSRGIDFERRKFEVLKVTCIGLIGLLLFFIFFKCSPNNNIFVKIKSETNNPFLKIVKMLSKSN